MEGKTSIDARLVGRPIRVTISHNATVVAQKIFASGADLTIGSEASADLKIPEWSGENLILISAGYLLHLRPGMRLHMCHDNGEDRVKGTYEELAAAGVGFPIHINVSKLNISLSETVSLYAKYLSEGEG